MLPDKLGQQRPIYEQRLMREAERLAGALVVGNREPFADQPVGQIHL